MRMLGGVGAESYTRNSEKQALGFALIAPALKDAIAAHGFGCDTKENSWLVRIADLGCATGNNSISAARFMAEAVRQQQGSKHTEIQAFFSDLSSNDFNTLFQQLGSAESSLGCFVAGVPGSFYGRLFPSSSLHIVLCSFSLHWLSKIPDITTHVTSGQFTSRNEAFAMQAHKDLCRFLACRAQEIVSQGILAMLVLADTKCQSEYVSMEDWYVTQLQLTWNNMLIEGLIDEGTHGSFRMPWFFRRIDEIVKANVDTGEKFTIVTLEQSKCLAATGKAEGSKFQDDSVTREVSFCRNITGSSISRHLKDDQCLVDEFYKRLHARFVKENPCNVPEIVNHPVAIVVLRRK